MASAAWIMSEAVRRIQGRTAMVYYGSDVFPTLKPGEHMPDVKVYTAPDGTEKFDRAATALDGILDLTSGTGARMLVIVSDGYYVAEEQKKCREWLAKCAATGVGVLWVGFGRSCESAERFCKNSGAVFVNGGKNPTEAALAIGQAAAKALTVAGAGNDR